MNLLDIARAYGVPDPTPGISGTVHNPFASGTFDFDAAALTTVIDLSTPSVWSTDPFAARELDTSGSDMRASLVIYGACLEFLDQDIHWADAESIAQVAEGLYLSVESGSSEKRFPVGFSVFGEPAGIVDSDLATTTGLYGYPRQYSVFPATVIDLDSVKTAAIKATAAATGSLLPANSPVRLHVRGVLVAHSTAPSMADQINQQCRTNPVQSLASSKAQADAAAVKQTMILKR